MSEAKQQLKKFFMGKHLPHAPKSYLKTMNLTGLWKLWREEQTQSVSYDYHIGRGSLLSLTNLHIHTCIHNTSMLITSKENLRPVLNTGAYKSAKSFKKAGSVIQDGKVYNCLSSLLSLIVFTYILNCMGMRKGNTQSPKSTQSPI